MSGDVQPRKRKEKRRKKDDLGVEEPRGTAAIFGEGDVFIHSHHEHGTGGHWCAKIIFFSLLAVLVTLIGLIILENRGLSELEANAVESRYSGVLEGWIEDAPVDEHHDEHTLELKHHRYEDNQDGDDDEPGDSEHSDEDDQEDDIHENDEPDDEKELENFEELQDNEELVDDEDEHDHDDEYEDDDNDDYHEEEEEHTTENVLEIDNQDDEDADSRQTMKEDEDDESMEYNKYYKYNDHHDNVVNDENLDSDDSQEDEDDNESNEIIEDNDDSDISYEENDNQENINDENSELNEDEDDFGEEIESIEKEFDELDEAISGEAFNIDEKDAIKDSVEAQEIENEEMENILESEEVIEPPIVERITAPSGKPFIELEDGPSTEKPADTLAEEEEYEKRQEQIRLEKQESSSQTWLKMTVGGALLLATYAVIRRFTAPRDAPDTEDDTTHEDDSTLIDRRMTLIPKETAPLFSQKIFEPVQVEPDEAVVKPGRTIQSDAIYKQEEKQVGKREELVGAEITSRRKDVVDQELYSDDDDEEVAEEDDIEKEVNEFSKGTEAKVENDADEFETEEVPDDVEIIDDEQIEEEVEEEDEDEEEISDVDDAELLSRLEAKYGRLPEPERPGYKHSKHYTFECIRFIVKQINTSMDSNLTSGLTFVVGMTNENDGGNNIEDEWPGEPSEHYWRQQLDLAEQEIRQGEWAAASTRLSGSALERSARALWLAARALDAEAEQRRDNKLLSRAISAYLQLLKMNERLPNKKLLQVTDRVLDRIQFRGNYLSAEPVYRILIRRFPDNVSYRNNLTVSFLMANRADLAGDLLKETLKLWPNDRIALAHYGFVLKTQYNKLEESVELFRKALENDTGPACEPRFYYHLGDALLLLGRFDEAHEVHKRGAKNGHFLSPAQRSLYNVNRLKSRPWWSIQDTPYVKLAQALEKSWRDVLKEGEAARALYEKEKEGLKEKGEWSQLDLFVRGQEIPGRCKRAPVTCSIVKSELAAAYCRRGQIKFSSMEPGTHVRPHVGPTNCRLRMHLGLSNTKDTYIRVDQDTRQWQLGKVLLFDDSFEHEVWHNGTGTRLVLIVDVWHPDLTLAERRQLPAI